MILGLSASFSFMITTIDSPSVCGLLVLGKLRREV